MIEQHLKSLLKDIVAIQQDIDFGNAFAISLVEADRYDRLIIKLLETNPAQKILVEFSDYPALELPQLSAYPEGNATAESIAKQATERLTRKALPLDLRTVVDLLLDTEQRPISPQFLSRPISHIDLPSALYQQIKTDYKQHAPNEYAYLLSGTIDEEGNAQVLAYYAGEMAVSNPVYCELTDEFVEKAVYDLMPKEHNLIVWGHVHPIEGASGTDVASFAELAEWDRNIATVGHINKRSVALLVSSLSFSTRFYDVHSEELIKEKITHD